MKKILTIEDMKETARKKGGKCLSKEYIKNSKKLEWECHLGHRWFASSSNVRFRSWCHVCARITISKARIKYSLLDAQTYAKSKGGKCLSTVFKTAQLHSEWECAKGHIWKAKFIDMIRKRSIKSNGGGWCPKCQWESNKLSLEDAQNIASEYNGKCLSKEYLYSTNSHLEWECEEKHRWKASLNNVRNNNSWCPECMRSRGEKAFKKAIEDFTGKKFIKCRPDWLKNKSGNKLELDGYNEELKIAFEFQGLQHYKYVKHLHKTREKYRKQKEYDNIKVKKCKKLGIILLTPDSRLKIKDYMSFIKENLKKYEKY